MAFEALSKSMKILIKICLFGLLTGPVQAQVWDKELAITRAFESVSSHYDQFHGDTADQSFFYLSLSGHETNFYILTADWRWMSTADAFIWGFQCYLTAEYGPRCYQSHTKGDIALDDHFRTAIPRHSIAKMLIKVNEALKPWGKGLMDLEIYVTSQGYWVKVQGRVFNGAYLCPFEDGISCREQRVNALPLFPKLK